MKNLKSAFTYNWFEEIWNNGDESLIDHLLSPDCIAHGITPEGSKGPEAFKKFYREFRSQFKDIHVNVKHVVAERDFEVALCHCEAVHIPTGKKVQFSGQCMIRNAFGQVAESWNNFDFLSMYQQLGYELKPPAQNNS